MGELVQIPTRKAALAKRRLFIRTFGCQMNEYDSLKLGKILEKEYALVDTPERADVVIVNTCSVRDKPEQKLYSYLGELRDLKAQYPEMMIGVGGCVAQQEGQRIVDRSRAVDFVFGTHNLSLVPSLISRRRQGAKPQVAVNYRDEWEELPLGLAGESRISTFVSISRGCNKNCTYCIVPTTRGPEVSRDAAEIEKEVRLAVHRGAKEIILLGQTVNSYGLDFSPRRSFVWLLEKVAAIPGVERIRFTSPHPQEIRKDFVEAVSTNPKICRHVHMPLQSGSDRILKAMNRNYRRKRYLSIIEDLKARVPDIGITTDIIVGFPGESEADFHETLEVMRQVQFDGSYSFMFSPRPGTAAAKMEDSVPAEEKLRRLQELQALQLTLTAARLESWVGKDVEVLIDGPSSSNAERLQGRISQNIVLNIDEEQYNLSPGNLVLARVTESARFTLKGKILAGVT
jgi:tRNA-2-methylthio-N6-dimethylallyladenosine synthase